MAYKTDVELKTQVDAVIRINGNREITPPLHNSIETNIIDSKLSLAGGNVLLNLTGYTTELTPTDNKHLTPKRYVDDQITASVSDTAYNATTWNGVTTIAPSKNAVRDEFEKKVNLLTGDILFNFHSASAFDITNDGAGGNYSKGYLYFDSSEIEFGWGINYMSVGSVTGFVFRNAGGVITMPSTTGTIALTSDVSAVISDTAYAGSWNGVTGIAPSKNAVYDKIELISADITAAIATAEAYADSLVVGLWDDRGSFDASVNAYPSSGGSGSAGAIKKGDIWTISVAGTLPTGQAVNAGDTVRALQDTPGNTQANWAIAEGNLGYTPVTNARTLTINGTAFDLSANRSWTVGDALLGTAQTFTADKSFTANIFPTASNTYDLGANTTTGDWRRLYTRTIQPADVTTSNTTGTTLTLSPGLGNGTGAETFVLINGTIKGSSGVAQTQAAAFKIGLQTGSSVTSAIYYGGATPNASNYSIAAGTNTWINGQTGGSVFLLINNTTKFTVNSASIITGGTAVYRLTNGGPDGVAHLMIDPANTVSAAGALAYAFDTSNGMSFTHANGTLRVRGWSAKLTNLVNTAGSESSDITWTPQNATDKFIVAGVLQGNGPVGFASYTVGTLPSAATAGQMIYVSDESGGAVMAFSDGTNWRRVTDRAIVS